MHLTWVAKNSDFLIIANVKKKEKKMSDSTITRDSTYRIYGVKTNLLQVK